MVLNRPNIKHLFLARFSDNMQLNLHMSEKSCNFAAEIGILCFKPYYNIQKILFILLFRICM